MKSIQILLLSLLTLSAVAGAQEALEHIAHGVFNEMVKVAHQSDEKWVSHPVMVSLVFIQHHTGGQKVIGHEQQITVKSTPETFQDAVVTVERSGFLDDSIAGDKYVITLRRKPGNTWLVESARFGRRCRAGRGHTNYSNQPCS